MERLVLGYIAAGLSAGEGHMCAPHLYTQIRPVEEARWPWRRFSSWARISTESVFATDQAVLEGSPATLRARHCLTDDYTTSEGEEAAAVAAALQRCVQRLERGGLEPACDGVPVVSLLYVCLANSLSQLDGPSAPFDWAAFERSQLAYTPVVPTNWFLGDEEPRVLLEGCLRSSDARLTPRQSAVYAYSCWQWTVACQCHVYRYLHGGADDLGKLRYIRLLADQCPVSPSRCLDAFGAVTGRSWAECSGGMYDGDDLETRYAAEVSRVTCLLQDFTDTETGLLDGPRLRQANFDNSTNVLKRSRMDRVIREAAMLPDGGSFTDKPLTVHFIPGLSTLEFVRQWATGGTLACAYQDANRLASQFPDGCTVTA
ncbi:hypothetical protein FJT64_024187 [Amphibalanus amphitrite]|uniref:Uncharacterized protein n=1 Tax=Amphibalanus amphitrite TaxID=1232801 RepID=A0A6A4WBB0_AMPAM|nr:hypothetical protein FJT64_024187 [Amphibalanus amphitrite]